MAFSPLPVWLFIPLAALAAFAFVKLYGHPKPLPGIPYHAESANRLLGDLPGLIAHFKKHRTRTDWVVQQCNELNSPIIQLFLKPFGRPWVVIADHWEGEDILARRFQEFDRSSLMGDLFGGVVPNATIVLKSDHVFKAKRKLWADTMSPSFQNDVVAPAVHEAARDLCDVLVQKARLTHEHPFEVGGDVSAAVFDSVWSAFVGEDGGTNKATTRYLSSVAAIDLPVGRDEGVKIPKASTPSAFKAIQTISESLHVLPSSPMMKLHGRLIPYFPSQRHAYAFKNEILTDRIGKARARHARGSYGIGERPRSAIDMIASKEAAIAEKEGRSVTHKEDLELKDEIVSWVIAGHETTSAVITTGLKWLADRSEWQSRLRGSLKAALSNNPSTQEIMQLKNHLLDATIEEMLRCASVGGSYSRVAMVDAEILGHFIPKGTVVWCMANGASYNSPAFSINDGLRSDGALERMKKQKPWANSADLGTFRPQRWLVGESDDGEFDPRAGPSMPHSAGPRGCFGRKMAYTQLRLLLVPLILKFEYLQIPDELNSYARISKVTHEPQMSWVRVRVRKD